MLVVQMGFEKNVIIPCCILAASCIMWPCCFLIIVPVHAANQIAPDCKFASTTIQCTSPTSVTFISKEIYETRLDFNFLQWHGPSPCKQLCPSQDDGNAVAILY